MCKTLYPGAFYPWHQIGQGILMLSYVAALILLLLYVLYLYFKLYSHADLWDEDLHRNHDADVSESSSLQFHPAYALVLVIILLLILVYGRYLVSSVDELVASLHITTNFRGLILLLILTNMSNYINTYAVAYEGHMDLAVTLTLSTSIDIAFFTLPILILLGRGNGQPKSMDFEPLETVMLVLSAVVMAGLAKDGRSTYLEGLMCLGLYSAFPLLTKFEKSIR
jgi:Ca2+:H+ antiporter